MTRLLFVLGLCALLWQCSLNEVAGGGSTETGNTIVGRVTSIEGAVVGVSQLSQLKVSLLHADHAPTQTASGFEVIPLLYVNVDSVGEFTLNPVSQGFYNLEIRDPITGSVLLYDSLFYEDTSKTFILSPAALRMPAQIRGLIPVQLNVVDIGAVYVPGTTAMTVDFSTGSFLLSNVPAGTHEVRFRSRVLANPRCEYCVDSNDVQIDTTVVVLPNQVIQLEP